VVVNARVPCILFLVALVEEENVNLRVWLLGRFEVGHDGVKEIPEVESFLKGPDTFEFAQRNTTWL
jgi:hypothetical protein